MSIEVNKIYNEPAQETMSRMSDKFVDLTMADFPYGIEENYDEYVDSKENLITLVNSTMPELLRISKILFITCGIANIFLYPKPDWIIAWVNEAGTGSTSWGFNCWQPVLVYGKCPYLANLMGRRADIIKTNETSEKNAHPCPKPLKFWSKLMHRGSAKEGDLIYDPMMGSGTTALAAIKYKRNYIGSEISQKYFNLANERIEQHQRQTVLF